MERCFVYLLSLCFWLSQVACGILVPSSGIEHCSWQWNLLSPNHWTVRGFPRKWTWWRLGHKSVCTACSTSTKLSTSGRNVNNVSCIFIYFFIFHIIIWRCITEIFLKYWRLPETANVYLENVTFLPNKVFAIQSPELSLFLKF